MIAVTSLYLAGKVEEEHIRLTDAINVTYRLSTGYFCIFCR